MNPIFPHHHLLVLLFFALLTYSASDNNHNEIQCVESERDALLQFKQGISFDGCGLLHSWGNGPDCCLWGGVQCNNRSSHVVGLKLAGSEDYNDYCLEGKVGVSLLELKHLKYLDLSNNYFRGQIPKFIGSLSNLRSLSLANNKFSGVIPQEIGNLSRLTSLNLNQVESKTHMRVESLSWLSQLRSLREMDLRFIDLSVASNSWLSIVNNLPFVQILRLDYCRLSLKLPSSLSYINSSSTLRVISLSDNNLNDTSIFEWLFNLRGVDTNLVYLDLSDNQMFGNNLQLSSDAFKLIGNLCNLQTLDLSSTNLNYSFSDIVQSFSKCPHIALMFLYLDYNQVWGSIPDNINLFSLLTDLIAHDNKLTGTINEVVSHLSKLEILDLSSNFLEGILCSSLLSNLPKLSELSLSNNRDLVVNISSNWIPPFQLETLELSYCNVGPNFPNWILTQKHLEFVEISNAGIVDSFPNSLWNSSSINYLNMSRNKIYGTIPDEAITFIGVSIVDLSSNDLEGTIPSFLGKNVLFLNLNNNKFTKGLVPLLCFNNKYSLQLLYLSNNSISEKLPDCLTSLNQLIALHLDNNHLWGNLPTTIGTLNQLVSLHLSNNKLSGELPVSLLNCSSLAILDVAHNSLTGYISPNFGYSFKYLGILRLQNNHFFGDLPSSFCQLSQLQLLDLSKNQFSGTIPRCIYKLKGMTTTNNVLRYVNWGYEIEQLMWKGEERTFGGRISLGILRGIDISDNKLDGQIPEGIANLIGLRFLNLSRNNLNGSIMSSIGQLTSLESLDLSHNRLSGVIPASLVKISSLSVLYFSYNNLFGKIPTGTQLQTFGTSSYIGNPGLCGLPLPKCYVDEAPNSQNVDKDEDSQDEFMLGLYTSVVLGIIVGFWGVFGTLAVKTSWRHAYFRFLEDARDRIYVMIVVNVIGAWRRS